MIAAYLRVSTRGQSVAMQRDAIERAAKARGHAVDVWFSEKTGGSAAERPQLDLLRADVRAGKFARVFTFRLDRLSRGGIRATLSILEELESHGCKVETVADEFSLQGPARELIIAVLACCAQMERSAIGERISAARTRIEAKGGNWGRPRRADDSTIERIRALHGKRTVREISAALKVPHGTVQNVLSKKGVYKPRLPGPAKAGVR
jgi:DNA invertase Pin-like site-specific DNA recombinase